jgi:hypothetical protein
MPARKKAKKKRSTRTRASRRSAATSPEPVTLAEETWFIHDAAATNPQKNTTLAVHLNGVWNDLAIVRIDRIEIGETGWMATYRV